MNRNAKSKLDAITNDIYECNTAYSREAYDIGRKLMMKYEAEIPGMSFLESLYYEPYYPAKDSEYVSGVYSFQDMLRKYKADLQDHIHILEDDLHEARKTLSDREKAIQEKDKTIQENKILLEVSEKRQLDYRAEIKSLEDAYRKIRQELDDQRRECRNLLSDLTKAQEENKILREENKKLRSENSTLCREIENEKKQKKTS